MTYPDAKDWNYGNKQEKETRPARKLRSHTWQLDNELEWYRCSICGTTITLEYLEKQELVENIHPPSEFALDFLWHMGRRYELPVHQKCPVIQ